MESTTPLSTRQRLARWALQNSQLVHYLDEALAETYKITRLTGSPFAGVRQGMAYPFRHPELYDLSRGLVIKEATAYALLPFAAGGVSAALQEGW